MVGNGLLKVMSNSGNDLIYAGAAGDSSGFWFEGYSKTGEVVVVLFEDANGDGVAKVYNHKGEGRTLKPDP